MPPTELERIATLEALAAQSDRERKVLFTKLEKQEATLKAVHGDLQKVTTLLARYRGFFGGIIFTVTALGAAIGAAVTALWQRVAG